MTHTRRERDEQHVMPRQIGVLKPTLEKVHVGRAEPVAIARERGPGLNSVLGLVGPLNSVALGKPAAQARM